MLSLANAFNEEDLLNFEKRINDLENGNETGIVIEDKKPPTERSDPSKSSNENQKIELIIMDREYDVQYPHLIRKIPESIPTIKVNS